MDGPITEAWKAYERDCISKDAPDIQREVMRQSFYLSAIAMFKLVYADTRQTHLLLGQAHDELEAFADEVFKEARMTRQAGNA